jgi:hypothetical protein
MFSALFAHHQEANTTIGAFCAYYVVWQLGGLPADKISTKIYQLLCIPPDVQQKVLKTCGGY